MTRPSRTERRRARTKETILVAAEDAFAADGFDAASIERIAEAADVGVGSIYNHFGSKDGLYLAVIERALEHDEDVMQQAYVPGRSALEQLEAAGEAYLRLYLERPEHFRMIAFPQRRGGGPAATEVADRLAERVARLNQQVADALRRAIADGQVRPVDVERTTTLLWAAWNGIIALGWRQDRLGVEEDELVVLIELARDVVRHGLLPVDDR